MPNIEYQKADANTLQITKVPDPVPTVRSVGLDELLNQEALLVVELAEVRAQIAKCGELGIRSRIGMVLENDVAKREANAARRMDLKA